MSAGSVAHGCHVGLNKVCCGVCLVLKLLGNVRMSLERREWFLGCLCGQHFLR